MLKAPTGSIEIRHGNVKTFKKWGLLWKLGGETMSSMYC